MNSSMSKVSSGCINQGVKTKKMYLEKVQLETKMKPYSRLSILSDSIQRVSLLLYY